MPQSQTAVLPKHQEEEETDKTKQAQIEQTYEKQVLLTEQRVKQRLALSSPSEVIAMLKDWKYKNKITQGNTQKNCLAE